MAPALSTRTESTEVLIDAGLVMYVGLAVLFIWRYFCAWRCCGRWLQYANYCSLLLGLIFVILTYDTVRFIQVALSDQGKQSWDQMPVWIKPWVLACPGICAFIFILTAFQTFQHVERIHEDTAVVRHDRAVQIILLPAVYSVMGMSSLVRMYSHIGSEVTPYSPANSADLGDAIARSQTCFMVGDLYEAWALFQFGKLTLEVIESGIMAQARSADEQMAAAANGLRSSHRAVESLAWLGILSFLLVCVAEAGWALWLLTFAKTATGNVFDESMSQFTIAGFLASGAAIYNVFIVEENYALFLQNYYPRWKFLTVKILVTFAFVQKGAFKSLMFLATFLPERQKAWVDKVPVIGTFMNLRKSQFQMFYGALIISECLLVCIAHYWAWDSRETWYDDADVADMMKEDDLETLALKGSVDRSYGAQKG